MATHKNKRSFPEIPLHTKRKSGARGYYSLGVSRYLAMGVMTHHRDAGNECMGCSTSTSPGKSQMIRMVPWMLWPLQRPPAPGTAAYLSLSLCQAEDIHSKLPGSPSLTLHSLRIRLLWDLWDSPGQVIWGVPKACLPETSPQTGPLGSLSHFSGLRDLPRDISPWNPSVFPGSHMSTCSAISLNDSGNDP